MGFLDKLLGREKKDDMPAEPQMRDEEAAPMTPPAPEGGMTPPAAPEPSEGEGDRP